MSAFYGGERSYPCKGPKLKPNPLCGDVWSWAFGRYLGLDEVTGWSPHEGISAAIRRDMRAFPFSLPPRLPSANQEESLLDSGAAGTWILDCQSPEP